MIEKKQSRAKVKVDSLKLVLVGDAAVGKSAAIRNYMENIFDESYEPTVLDVYRGKKSINKRDVELELHDTSGDNNMEAARKIQY